MVKSGQFVPRDVIAHIPIGSMKVMSNNFVIVRDAVVRRLQVVATYKGHRRWMCPHVLGWKNGRAQALFYQFAGGSSTRLGPPGSRDNWRCIPVDALEDVVTSPGEWFSAPNHSRP